MNFRSVLAVIIVFFPAFAAQAGQVLKIATLAPDGTSWMQEMRAAGKEIAKRTNNRVTLKFYPGGIMGNEASVLRKMRIGQLQGSALTNTTLGQIAPEAMIYSMPLKFRSYEESNFVRKKMDKVLLAGLKREGYTVYQLAGDGFAYLYSQEPVNTLAQLQQQKVWIPKDDTISRVLLEELGISPISLPLTDVLTGLQTGLFTTVGSPPAFTIALQWHTKVKYMVDLPMFFNFGALAFSNKSLEKISNADQAVMQEVLVAVFDRMSKANWENNLKAREALQKQGIIILTPSEQERKKLLQLADKVTRRLIKEGVFKENMVKEVESLLTAYRKSK
ncbi:MAG: TRAP transporter substrate-binding protein DctP [Gammaproteobacteria bacterium]|nr:TRAP transporter substrate-binding protein DctP [Gammaproteobacteria bacterium]MDH5653625.1 TRAP transporter substrate-binding protein DctP [Gammaproteobacteria bacterium]